MSNNSTALRAVMPKPRVLRTPVAPPAVRIPTEQELLAADLANNRNKAIRCARQNEAHAMALQDKYHPNF